MLIRNCTIAELLSAPNIHQLLDEYGAECAIAGLPKPAAKFDMYRTLQESGAMHVIGAFIDDVVAGYITILASVLPHYSVLVAVTESFFVGKEYRKTGAGLKLLSEAEKYAASTGSPGLLVSAPSEGDLAELLPHKGYDETSRVFFKSFKNG